MDYYLITQDKIIEIGDTVNFLITKAVGSSSTVISLNGEIGPGDASIEAKILGINPKEQSFSVTFKELDGSTIDISISMWEGVSIIEKGKQTDPNILFKLKGIYTGKLS